MMEHKCSGRLDMLARSLWVCLLTLTTSSVSAEPVPQDIEFDALIESTVNGWADALLPDVEPLDEQIFTEISPLIDSPDGVRLPEDQQLAD